MRQTCETGFPLDSACYLFYLSVPSVLACLPPTFLPSFFPSYFHLAHETDGENKGDLLVMVVFTANLDYWHTPLGECK